MSQQLNINVSGRVTIPPVLLIDNGHRYNFVFETPTRGWFAVDDAEPFPYGATVLYDRASTARLTLPGPGQWEAALPPVSMTPPILTYRANPGRIIVKSEGFFTEDGRPWYWRQMTGLCDYQLLLTGQIGRLEACWQQAQDIGARGRRVLGSMAFITNFKPQDYGDAFFTRLPELCERAADYDQRIHFDACADMQVNMPDVGQQREYWARVCDALRPVPTAFVGLGNQWPKNGFTPTDFVYPGFPCSQGSTLEDAAPPMPGWGIRAWTGRRGPGLKVYQAADDMIYVQRGVEGDTQTNPRACAIHVEPIGFAEVDIPGRRSTDPELARSLGLTMLAYGNGGDFHCEDAIYSRLIGPIQYRCGQALFSVFPN